MDNEKGFTLIEVLLTLVILSIVGLLAFSVLHQSTKSKNTISSSINLSNETNIILAMIEREYYAQNDLCLDWNEHDKKAYIKKKKNWVMLHPEDIVIEEIIIDPLLENKCVSTDERVKIQLSVNEKGKTVNPFKIETTLKRIYKGDK